MQKWKILQKLERDALQLSKYTKNRLLVNNLKSEADTLKSIIYSINFAIKYSNTIPNDLLDSLEKYSNEVCKSA